MTTLPTGELIHGRNVHSRPGDLARELTAFLITVGEPTTPAALACLHDQTAGCEVEVIDHVAPMNVAFQAMIDRCRTRYYVQVDADMLLHRNAVWSLYEAIAHYRLGAAMVCAPLWDDFDDRPIYGVKVYDHEVFSRFPYRDSLSCETDQLARLKAAGHWWQCTPLAERDECFGLHGTSYTPREAFTRYRGLVWKQRRSVVQYPPWGELAWTEALHGRHLEAWRRTGDVAHLAASLGLVAGLVGALPPEREDDFRLEDEDWSRIEERYFLTRELPEWVMDWRKCAW